MKCPSCGKELERMKRQVGTTESGDPIFNEYAAVSYTHLTLPTT